jgi:hypothetical protein
MQGVAPSGARQSKSTPKGEEQEEVRVGAAAIREFADGMDLAVELLVAKTPNRRGCQ